MSEDSVVSLCQPGEFEDLLTDVLRQGARKLLAQAVEAEVADFLAVHADLTIEDGRQRLVRHGHLPERTIQTGIWSVEVKQPCVRDRGSDSERIRFSPAILPPYASGGFQEALSALLGKDALNLWSARKPRGKRRSSAGSSMISQPGAMCISGPMACSCRPVWQSKNNAFSF